MIKVSVYPPDATHKSWRLVWIDPETGRKLKKSAKTTNHSKAERAAAAMEEKLSQGLKPPSEMSWRDFWGLYEKQVLSGYARNTASMSRTVKRVVDRLAPISRLSMWTPQAVSRLVAALRSEQKSEDSIRSYLSHLHMALAWAREQQLIPAVPVFPRIRRAKRMTHNTPMKGRPLTETEFASMLAFVPAVVGEKSAPSWRYFLEGLWSSGLRLEESLNLTWDDPESWRVVLNQGMFMLRVPRTQEKSFRDRLLPIAPEFADFLAMTPPDQREGYVFNLTSVGSPGRGRPRTWVRATDADWVSRIVTRIGKKAGIVVSRKKKTPKYASAHDLRRSFGERWSGRVQPADLMILMRHRDIATTMRYYVGRNAGQVAQRVWAAVNRGPECSPEKRASGPVSGPVLANAPQKGETAIP